MFILPMATTLCVNQFCLNWC